MTKTHLVWLDVKASLNLLLCLILVVVVVVEENVDLVARRKSSLVEGRDLLEERSADGYVVDRGMGTDDDATRKA